MAASSGVVGSGLKDVGEGAEGGACRLPGEQAEAAARIWLELGRLKAYSQLVYALLQRYGRRTEEMRALSE
jgi:hypothetical protein